MAVRSGDHVYARHRQNHVRDIEVAVASCTDKCDVATPSATFNLMPTTFKSAAPSWPPTLMIRCTYECGHVSSRLGVHVNAALMGVVFPLLSTTLSKT